MTLFSSFIPTIYVQVSPERLIVRNAKTGKTISEVPEIAIEHHPKHKIVGVGNEAHTYQSTPSVKVSNPFAHPRTLLSDFTSGEQLLRAFLSRLQGNSIFAVSPRVVIHPMGDPISGFTQIEIRALHEMAMGAGASQVVVWQGRGLSDQELLSREFPSTGQILS